MKKLNILFTSDSLGVSGAEIVLLNIIQNIDREKFSLFVFCNAKNEKLIQKITKLNIEYKTSLNFPKINHIGQYGVKPKKLLSYLSALTRINLELLPYIKSNEIDIIYANSYPNCLYYLISSLSVKVSLIWHVHNIKKIHSLNFIIYYILGFVCANIITVSNACKNNLLKAKIKPQKIVTIYNGIDLKKFNRKRINKNIKKNLGLAETDRIVGLFGQPIPEKGHRYFIGAAAEVLKEFTNVRFLIVGYLFDSEYQKKLYKLIDRLNIKKNVLFTGWRDDVPDIMASIDILAHTRITPEPAALVLMESMAMKIPIVASNNGGTPEIVQNGVTGFLVPSKDTAALAMKIAILLKNPLKAKKMGEAGKKRFDQYFTQDKQIYSIENLLLRVKTRN